MALPVKWHEGNLKGYQSDDTSQKDFPVTLEATCVTGFERAAECEVREKFNIQVTKHQVRDKLHF